MSQPPATKLVLNTPAHGDGLSLAMDYFTMLADSSGSSGSVNEDSGGGLQYSSSSSSDTDHKTYRNNHSPGPTSGVRPRGDLASLAACLRNSQPGDDLPPEASGIVVRDPLAATPKIGLWRSKCIRIWIVPYEDPGSAFAVVTSSVAPIRRVKKLIEEQHPRHPKAENQRFGRSRDGFPRLNNDERIQDVISRLSTHLPDPSADQQETGVWVLKHDEKAQTKEVPEDIGVSEIAVQPARICHLLLGALAAFAIKLVSRWLMA